MKTSPTWRARPSSPSPARTRSRRKTTDPLVHLGRFRTLARSLDSQFGIPGTPFRFGWDALIGLFPVVGDAAGGLLGAYGLYVATQLGAPSVVLIRMFLNLGVDILLGLVPVAGDVADVAWRANLRNLALLERWLERPRATLARSGALLLGLLALLAALAGGVLWLAVGALRALTG